MSRLLRFVLPRCYADRYVRWRLSAGQACGARSLEIPVENAWTRLTVAGIENAMPTDLARVYASWFDANPAKANRLTETVAEVLGTFRCSVEANPANELDPDPNTVPVTGFRHAQNMVIFNLGMEMGIQFAPEVFTLIARAEIWLRMVQNGGIAVGTRVDRGTPSYSGSERMRWLLG